MTELLFPAALPVARIHAFKSALNENPLAKHFSAISEKIAFLGECQAQFNDSDQVKELDTALRDLIDLQKDCDIVKSVSARVLEEHRTNGGDTSTRIFEQVEVEKAEYRDKPPRDKYDQDKYDDFKRRVFDIEHPNDDYPGIASFFTTTHRDDDMEMTYGTKRNLKCPLTLLVFKEPMRNKICPHVFSREAIEGMIRVHGSCECPVPGCGKILRLGDLLPDKVTERRVREEAEEAIEGEALSDDDRDILVL